jgi:hypothetical protein
MVSALLSFAGTLVSCVASLALLFWAVVKAGAPRSREYEHKFRALKYARTVTYCVLAACQVGVCQRQGSRPPPR